MKQLSLLTLCLFTFFVSQAQPDSTKSKKQKTFIASVRTLDNKRMKGRLYSVNDTQLVLTKSIKHFPNFLLASDLHYIPAENIKSFSLKKRGTVLNEALIGFGLGAATGIVSGLASGDDDVYTGPVYDPLTAILVALGNAFAQTAEEKAFNNGLTLGIASAIVGTTIGALAKKRFIVGGNKEKFHDMQPEIRRKLGQK